MTFCKFGKTAFGLFVNPILKFCRLLFELGVWITIKNNKVKQHPNHNILRIYSPCNFNKAKPREIPKRVMPKHVDAVVKISSIIILS